MTTKELPVSLGRDLRTAYAGVVDAAQQYADQHANSIGCAEGGARYGSLHETSVDQGYSRYVELDPEGSLALARIVFDRQPAQNGNDHTVAVEVATKDYRYTDARTIRLIKGAHYPEEVASLNTDGKLIIHAGVGEVQVQKTISLLGIMEEAFRDDAAE